MEHISKIINRKAFNMQAKLIYMKEKSFTNDKGQIITGKTLGFLNTETGEFNRYFINNEDLKGFDPKQLAVIKGPDVEVSTNVKTYLGKTRVVLDKIVQLV